MFRFPGLIFLIASLLAGGPAPAQEPVLVRTATGSLTGAYFPVGVAVCRLVNMTRAEHGIRCAAETSGGSIDNIERLRDGTADMAIVQSDVQDAAFNGNGIEPLDTLRAVFSLHPEPLTIVARADAGIASIADLEGKRVGIGNPGSGHRALWDQVMAAFGWSLDSFSETEELDPIDQAHALCNGSIDAYVMAVGHPALTVQEATLACDAMLVAATGPEVDALIADNRSYFATEIPGGIYPGNPDPVPTFGVGATLVTTDALDEEVVYTIVESVMDRLEELRALDQVLVNLDAADMVSAGLTAPLHPGAERYYREHNLID